MIATLVVSSSLLGIILSVTPSVEVTNVLYEVNDQGDLTIQVTGEISGISVENSHFRIKIPEEFEVPSLEDGSPVMIVKDNGSAQEIVLTDTQITLNFTLQTFNSTLLPKNYDFELKSSTFSYSNFITPRWPNQEPDSQASIGGGASIASSDPPFISSFYAYDSNKGNSEHVKTYVYNPSWYYFYNVQGARFKIDSTTYSNFEDWTKVYSESSGWIEPQYTYVFHDYLSPLYQSLNGASHYALNKGIFQVTEVYTYGSKLGGGSWSDSYYPSVSKGEFNVSIQSGTHPVFVAHLVDNFFRISHDEDAFFDDLEDWLFYISGTGDTSLKSYFDIDLYSYVLSWEAESPYDPDDLWVELVDEAAEIIGLSTSIWDNSSGGTQAGNNGFDILFGHIWHYNTKDNTVGKGQYNAGVAVRGYKVLFLGFGVNMPRLTMHELLHTYYCQHKPGSVIMNANHYSGDDTMHADTVSNLNSNIDLYDGV
jgi:hypothetical protein